MMAKLAKLIGMMAKPTKLLNQGGKRTMAELDVVLYVHGKVEKYNGKAGKAVEVSKDACKVGKSVMG